MKFKLKEICSITKGATGIMKATGGKYPLVALSDTRRSHNEFQFDANAVIVPLISSTGHGHASMKRVHYQEGKFALGNILCAVIPNDETKLNAKYLHLYLQQFKETLLVPLMKGAANVSLPMNKLADVEIEVPSFERQLEIIALEDKAAELKNELEEKLLFQDGDVTKLRQALLKEAMQGKLTKQNLKDGNAKDLLTEIKKRKVKLIKEKKLKEGKSSNQSVSFIDEYEMPNNWQWCKSDEILFITKLAGFEYTKHIKLKTVGEIPVVRAQNVRPIEIEKTNLLYIDKATSLLLDRCSLTKQCLLFTFIGAGIGDVATFNESERWHLAPNVAKAEPFIGCEELLNVKFLNYFLLSDIGRREIFKHVKATAQPCLSMGTIRDIDIPLPPLPEQNRIVKKLEELMKLCDDLQASIQASKTENEKLLQGALRDALKKKEAAKVISLPVLQPMEEKHFLKRKILATYIINQSLKDNQFGDVKFEKILHLSEYFAIKRNLGQKYFQKAAGPYDNAFTHAYFEQVEKGKWFNRKRTGNQFVFSAGQNHDKSTNTYDFFSMEELQRVNEIISYFKKCDYEQPEIVSTLYAVWNNRIIRQEQITNDLLIEDFYKWDLQKKKYEGNRLEKALAWMREKNFVPDGWGNVIEKVKKKSK